MNNLIQWPTAKYWTTQWNAVIGCKPISPACEHCYAAAWAKRFGQSFKPHKSSKRIPPRKGTIFCGNVTDLFGDWRTTEDMGNDIIHATIRGWDADATYLWLTKRVGNMCNALEWANKTISEHWFHNHYFGFTAENQEWYDKRFRESRLLPDWANWWISAEPLLGPIDLGLSGRHPVTGAFGVIPHLPSWVVVGCESGSNRRPCKIEWVESIVEQCLAANVPVFVKQLSIGGKCETDINKFPARLQIRQVPWARKGETK